MAMIFLELDQPPPTTTIATLGATAPVAATTKQILRKENQL